MSRVLRISGISGGGGIYGYDGAAYARRALPGSEDEGAAVPDVKLLGEDDGERGRDAAYASGLVGAAPAEDGKRLRLPGEDDAEADGVGKVKEDGDVDSNDRLAKMSGRKECETCKNRKYMDGSDEQVSFKSASKINPNAVEARVRAHEQEHVSNAYDKAEQEGGKVLQAAVTLKFAICPECGRSYCAGGVTHTMIKSPSQALYDDKQQPQDSEGTLGVNMDLSV